MGQQPLPPPDSDVDRLFVTRPRAVKILSWTQMTSLTRPLRALSSLLLPRERYPQSQCPRPLKEVSFWPARGLGFSVLLHDGWAVPHLCVPGVLLDAWLLQVVNLLQGECRGHGTCVLYLVSSSHALSICPRVEVTCCRLSGCGGRFPGQSRWPWPDVLGYQ